MILPLLKKNDVCSYHRLFLPFKYGGWWREEFETEDLNYLLSKASVVVFNRYWGEDLIHLLRAKKKYGFRIVCDIDDWIELYPNHVAYKGWKEWNMTQRSKESIMNADLVTTTTNRLADALRQFNKNIEVLPNGFPFDQDQFINDRHIEDKVRFLSAGGKTHKQDLKIVENCFRKLERKDSGKYEMVLAGYDEYDRDGTWASMERIVKGGSKDYRRIYRLPLDMYMNAFNNGDVVLAPLEPNYFNQFKSTLRIVEAGCKEMPIITSNYPPYSDEPSELILKATTTNDWYRHMKNFINDPQLVIDRGKALGEYVRANYDLKDINEKRRQIFERLSE